MLSEILEAMGCQIIHATGDADLLTDQTAVSVVADNMTVVVADDTDVLILLYYHYRDECQNFISSPKQNVDLSILKYGTFELQELLLV